MSSDDERDAYGTNKRRRINRACDTCRRRKSRCDGNDMPNSICTVCVATGSECTYREPAKKRAPSKHFTQTLESRLNRMENLMDGGRVNGQLPDNISSGSRVDLNPNSTSTLLTHLPSPESQGSVGDEGFVASEDDEATDGALAQLLQQLEIDPTGPRFSGTNSSVKMVKEALGLTSAKSDVKNPMNVKLDDGRAVRRRDEFWKMQYWESQALNPPSAVAPCQKFMFPDVDLLPILTEAYFQHSNIILPVLHRPTYERALAADLHWRDDGFANVVLAVSALGSCFIEDPRVSISGAPRSAGWKWFNQVQIPRKSLLAPPNLYDVQTYSLAAMFLEGASQPHINWALLGTGIRMAQDLGVHRKLMYTRKANAHDEQWKRAFWVLVLLDRTSSVLLGRPSAMHEEDMDLDLPLEVDDEFWEHQDPKLAFKQPRGLPSKVTSFVQMIKLNQILSIAHRTIYSLKRSQFFSYGQHELDWEEKALIELDSALNKWADAVPEHLRWDANRKDETFFHQSGVLYSTYHVVQITIHQKFAPFIAKKQTSVAVPALAQCTAAARSLVCVIEQLAHRRKGLIPRQMLAAFQAATIILLNLRLGSAGPPLDPAKAFRDVARCMDILEMCEPRWQMAGRLRDALIMLSAMPPPPEPSPEPLPYRGRQVTRTTQPAALINNTSESADQTMSNPINPFVSQMQTSAQGPSSTHSLGPTGDQATFSPDHFDPTVFSTSDFSWVDSAVPFVGDGRADDFPVDSSLSTTDIDALLGAPSSNPPPINMNAPISAWGDPLTRVESAQDWDVYFSQMMAQAYGGSV